MKFVQVTVGILLLVLSLTVGFVGYESYKVLTHIDQAVGTITVEATQTLESINRPCGTLVKGQLLPCGTLAEISKTTVNIGDIAKTAQIQVAQSAKVINASANAVVVTSGHVNQALDATTSLVSQGTETLQIANDNLQPLFTHTDLAVIDFDNLITSPSVHSTLDNAASFSLAASGSMQNIQGVTLDTKLVSDDLTKKYFAPQAWYKKIGPYTELATKLSNKILGYF